MTSVPIEVFVDERGLPTGAAAQSRIEAAPERVFAAFSAFEKYPGRVPMIAAASRRGDQVTVQLRFKVALFTARFEFIARLIEEPPRVLELRWLSGEPRGLRIRHDITPLDGGAASLVRTHIEFDVASLGWLVKYFLRHHPEIQFGVFSGAVLAMQHALRAAL